MGGCSSLLVRAHFRGYAAAPAFRFGPGPNAFAIWGALPNPEPDLGSGSPPMPNFEPDSGPVQPGSGPNRSSGPNCGITTCCGSCHTGSIHRDCPCVA